MTHAALPSERVIVAAPMSFAGSSARIWRITEGRDGWALAGMVTLAVLAVLLAWALVLAWYLLWGIWLIPYRIIRRGQRKRHREMLMHQEALAAIRGTQERQ